MRRLLWLALISFAVGCSDPPASSLKQPVPDPDGPRPTEPAEPGENPAEPAKPETLDGGGEGMVGTMAKSKDVVCGKDVDLNSAPKTHVWGDTAYLFCGDACLEKFKAAPKSYVK